ncbi:MAG: SDR family oxidoreductase [Rubellimicrobium sp.]|nr:SDR family oxidoreductase [Rubellimicrobium sp.]
MRIALVTGAAGGIGQAVVAALVADGQRVIALDRTPCPPPDGGEAHALDLTDEGAVGGVMQGIAARHGRLDSVFCIAGVNHQSTLEAMEWSAWERMMDVNVGHMFLTAKHAFPLLAKGEAPAMICLASVAGHVASDDYPAYVTTKAAVESFAWALAGEGAEHGIRVNALAPGWVDVGFTDAARAAAPDPSALDVAARAAHVLGRMARPDEVAEALLWLASPAASFVNATTMFVDGGFMRKH